MKYKNEIHIDNIKEENLHLATYLKAEYTLTKYYAIKDSLMKLKICDILAVRDKKDFISNLISGLSKEGKEENYSHIAIVYNKHYILEAYWDGIILTPIKEFFSRYTNWVILRCKKKYSRKKLLKDLKSILGIKYAYGQLLIDLWLLLERKLLDKENRKQIKKDYVNGLICTEAVGLVFHNQGINIKEDIKPAYLTPYDYISSNVLEKVYEYKRGEME